MGPPASGTTRRCGMYPAMDDERRPSIASADPARPDHLRGKAYLALIRRDSFTAAQVARSAGLPRQRIYDVLGSLVEKGLASARPGNVVKYAATPPELADRAAARRRTATASAARARCRRDGRPTSTPAFEAGRATPTRSSTSRCCATAAPSTSASRELQGERQARDPGLHQAALRHAAAGERRGTRGRPRAHDARCDVRVLGIFDDPAIARGVQRFIDAGEEARFVPDAAAQARDHRRDDRDVRDAGPGGRRRRPHHRGGRAPILAQTLKLAFNRVWDSGLELDAAIERRRGAVLDRSA